MSLSSGEHADPITHWKDPRIYDAATSQCACCLRNGRNQKLPNRVKAINHFASDGSGKEKSGTIKDCPYAHKTEGLVTYARLQNDIKNAARDNRNHLQELQHIRDSAGGSDGTQPVTGSLTAAVTMVPRKLTKPETWPLSKRPKTAQPNAAERLAHTAAYVTKLERAIASHMVEQAEALVVHQKDGFREMIDMAIEFGAKVGAGVFSHPGKKRMRDQIIPESVGRIDESTELKGYDAKIDKFGATLVSDDDDQTILLWGWTCGAYRMGTRAGEPNQHTDVCGKRRLSRHKQCFKCLTNTRITRRDTSTSLSPVTSPSKVEV